MIKIINSVGPVKNISVGTVKNLKTFGDLFKSKMFLDRALVAVFSVVALSIFVGPIQATAQSRTFLGGGVFQKDQDKESTRWTLADWLTQKKSFNAMDQWLALNRSLTLFELNIEASQQNYDLDLDGVISERSIEHYGASLYWSIFGLEYQFDKSNEDWQRESGQFNLRLLGASSQTTNLTAFYGIRKTSYSNPSNEIQHQFAGGKLNIYFVDFFGIEGQYQKNFREDDDLNIQHEGDRVEYGAFIDVYFVRIYGKGFKETNKKTDSSDVVTNEVREGTEAGVKLFF